MSTQSARAPRPAVGNFHAMLGAKPLCYTTPQMDTPRHRIAYIDGLRAIAVLSVVASHAYPIIRHRAQSDMDVLGITFGVNLFFVISGFCLAYPALRKLHDLGSADFDLARYAAHRFVRIVPPYYIAIALLYAASFFVPWVNHVSLYDVVRQALFLDRDTNLLTRRFGRCRLSFAGTSSFQLGCIFGCATPRYSS